MLYIDFYNNDIKPSKYDNDFNVHTGRGHYRLHTGCFITYIQGDPLALTQEELEKRLSQSTTTLNPWHTPKPDRVAQDSRAEKDDALICTNYLNLHHFLAFDYASILINQYFRANPKAFSPAFQVLCKHVITV